MSEEFETMVLAVKANPKWAADTIETLKCLVKAREAREAEIASLQNQLKEAQREGWDAARTKTLQDSVTKKTLSEDGNVTYQETCTSIKYKYDTLEDYLASKEKS